MTGFTPPPVRGGGGTTIRRLLGAIALVVRGRELVSITSHERTMKIDLEREMAEVDSRLELKNAQGKIEWDTLETHWGLHKDDWFILTERPKDFLLPPKRDQ